MLLKNSYIYFTLNRSTEQVIQILFKNNINVELYYQKRIIVYKVLYKDYKMIVDKNILNDINVCKYDGFIYFYYLLKRYYLALIMLFISVLLVFLFSYLIVDVRVADNNQSYNKMIIEALKKEGIKSFSWRKKYSELQDIKDRILDNYQDDIDWIEIKRLGMHYIINTVRRIKNDEVSEHKNCNILAKKDGMVTRVKTYHGQSIVSMNDYVYRDDLLISGEILRNEEIVGNVCASGVVYAEVWYTVDVKIPLNYQKSIYTGKKRNNIVIETENDSYVLLKDRLLDYESDKKLLFDFMNIKIYLRKDREIERIKQIYTEEDALKEAIKKAEEKIRIKLKNGEKIINKKVLQKGVIDSTMNVKIFIVTEESIGYQKVIE